MEKRYFPLFVDLSEWKVLVVGGGTVAARRVRSLAPFAGKITVVSPEICAGLREFLRETEHTAEIRILGRHFQAGDETGMNLVLACTDNDEVNREATKLARAAGIPANNCSDRTDCDFMFPGLSVRGPVTVGITAGGEDHRLVKEIRKRTDALLEEIVKENGA